MGSAWHEVSAPCRRAACWSGLLALLLLAACGGDRDAAPPADDRNVATADTSAPAPAPTTDTTAAAAPAARDTTTSHTDTAAGAKPAAKPATKPAPAPKPAPTPKPAPAAPPQDTSSTQPASQPQQPAPPQEAPLRDAYHQAPRDTVDQATYDGWKQYNLNCARCHGEDVLGTTIAPHLILSLKPDGPINTQELFVQTVCAGRPEKGMPSWCALGMDPAKINQIFAYVKGRSEGKIAPGRPAVRQGG
jgi:Cytochrome C oxidase, cbb3-type, subunit III